LGSVDSSRSLMLTPPDQNSHNDNLMSQTHDHQTKARILVAGHLPPPAGGVATYYQSLLNSSLPERVDLHFVQTSTHKRELSQSGKFSLSNLIAAVQDCGRFATAVIKYRPELTHIATAFGLSFVKHSVCVLIARVLGSRVLLHPHCGFPELYLNRSRWWQWYFRQVVRLTNGMITLSTEWDQLKEIVPGCRVYYLPNAIDLAKYQGVYEQKKLVGHTDRPLKMLYLGYLGTEKGTYDLLEAARETAAKNVPVTYDLIGDDLQPGDVEKIKKQVQDDNLTDTFHVLPFADGPRKVEALCNADVFVYPSYSEGMPMAVIEAMACGLPVIATRVGGLPDLVSDGVNGLLVEPRHPDQLASAIQRLCSNPELRSSMEKNSFKRAFEEYDMEVLVSRLVSIYSKALKSKE
jgi:glycosyltransferase involved in cell wall biosynthesis